MLNRFTSICLPNSKKDSWENFEKVRVYVLILLLMSVFLVSYFIYYSFNAVNHDWKHISNGAGVVLIAAAFFLLKKTGDISISAFPLAFSAIGLIVFNGYYSGGILSVDIFWFLVLSMASTMFLGPKIGLALGVASLGGLIFLYSASQLGSFDFRVANEQTGITYEFVNASVILLIAVVMVYTLERSNRSLLKHNKQLMEHEVAAIDQQYQFIAQHSQDLIAVLDQQANWTFASPAAEQILGIPPAELMGKPFMSLVDGNDDFTQVWVSIAGSEGDILPFKRANDQIIFLEVAGTQVFNPDQPTNYLLTLRDVTIKERNRQRVAQLKSQLARDFHDELGNRLAAISMISRSLNYSEGKTGSMAEKIESLQESASYLYKDFRDFIWSIDEANEHLNSLHAYLKDFGEDLFEHSTTDFFMGKPPDSLIASIVGGVKSRQIILMVKESLTNALKHANAKRVDVTMIVDHLNGVICIADDGIGMSQDHSKGVGLGSLKNRALKVGGDIKIESEPGRGTQICISFPLQTLEQ